jgi:signal peptide peptidase SppA
MNIARRIFTEALLLPELVLQSFAPRASEGVDMKAGELPYYKKLREMMKPAVAMTEDGLAIVSIEGVLARNPDPWEMIFYGPMEDTEQLKKTLDEVGNSRHVSGVFLDIDSPGGYITGIPESGELVRQMAAKKPVVAHTSGQMASAAYWIGSQANKVFASRSATVGSIGVYGTVMDYTKMLENFGVKVEFFRNKEGDLKGAGVMGTSLTEVQRTHIQDSIDNSFQNFKQAVTSARPKIKADAMRGQTMSGDKAIENGLIDGIASQGAALNYLRKMVGGI